MVPTTYLLELLLKDHLPSPPVWPDFATLAKFYKHLAILLGAVSIWLHFELTLAVFIRSIGQIFIVVKPKYWKMILPSGHTTFTANLPTYLPRGTNCSSGKSNHIRSKISVGDHLFLNAAWVDDDGDNDSANCQKLFYFFLFFKPAISGLFFFYFRLFNTIQLTVNKCSIKICRCLDSNRRPLISEATALPTELQPLPIFSCCCAL